MNRDNAFYAAIAAFVLLLVAWWVSATHWVDVQVRVPPTGEALTNDWLAAQNLARALGARVTVAANLDAMPPPGATLVLDWRDSDAIEGKSAVLRDWVQSGGHLILPAYGLPDDAQSAKRVSPSGRSPEDGDKGVSGESAPKPRAEAADPDSDGDGHDSGEGDATVESALSDWIALRKRDLPAKQLAQLYAKETQAEKDQAEKSSGARGAVGVQVLRPQPCRALQEPVRADYFSDAQPVRVCNSGESHTVLAPAQHTALWALDGERGREALRVSFGAGQVTALVPWDLLTNTYLPQGEHPLLAAAALQLRAGGEVWFLSPQKRQGLIAWLWDRAWPGLCLAFLVVAAALWRAAPRFGPVLAPIERTRRSMREQVVGTAEFLRQHGRMALLRAQARALRETARRRLRRTTPDAGSTASPAQHQTQAIAAACGMDAVALERAFNLADQAGGKISAQALTQALVLLDTAQRQLAQRR